MNKIDRKIVEYLERASNIIQEGNPDASTNIREWFSLAKMIQAEEHWSKTIRIDEVRRS